MTTSAVCRACLSSSYKLHCIANTGLQDKFEAFTKIKLTSGDGRPEKMCSICCALLQKLYDFVSMSQRSERLFKLFLEEGVEISEYTVSQLNVRKRNFGFSHLKSVSINISPKMPVADIKKEVIEINKDSYAETVEMSDILRDFDDYEVKEDPDIEQNQSADTSINLQHSPIVSTVRHQHVSPKRILNFELPGVSSMGLQHQIKKEVTDMNNAQICDIKNYPVKKQTTIKEKLTTDTVINMQHSSVASSVSQQHSDGHTLVHSENSPVIATMIHEHEIKKEVIEIDENKFAEMVDILKDFESCPVKEEPLTEEGQISDTTINLVHLPLVTKEHTVIGITNNLEHTPVRNQHRVSDTSVHFHHSPVIATMIHEHEIKKEVIEIDENKFAEMVDILKDFESCPVKEEPLTETQTMTTRQEHEIKKEVIETNKDNNAEIVDISKEFDHYSVKEEPMVEEIQISDTTIILEDSPSVSPVRYSVKEEPMVEDQISDTQIILEDSPLVSPVRHKHTVIDTAMNMENSRLVSTVRRLHRVSDALMNLKHSSSVSTVRHDHRVSDTSVDLEPVASTLRHVASDASVNLKHKISDSATNFDHISLLSTVKRQHRVNNTSGSLEHSPVDPIVKHIASDASVNLKHSPGDLTVKSIASDISVNLKRKIRDSPINVEHIPLVSTVKHLHRVSDTSVNLEHSPGDPTVKRIACDVSVNLKRKVKDSAMNSEHSPVISTVKHNHGDIELIHPGLSPILSEEDDEEYTFIAKHKYAPIVTEDCEYSELSEDEEMSLVIDDNKKKSSKQIQPLNKEQFKSLLIKNLFESDDEQSLNIKRAISTEENSRADQSNTNYYSPLSSPGCDTRKSKERFQDGMHLEKALLGPHGLGIQCVDYPVSAELGVDTESLASEELQPSEKKRKIGDCGCDSQSYFCEKCLKPYKNRNILIAHIRRKHPDMQIHGCRKCDIVITSLTDFINHCELSHPGEKFPCNKCRFKCISSNTLMLHRKQSHSETKERLNLYYYSCDTCGKKFTAHLSFKYHSLFVHPQ